MRRLRILFVFFSAYGPGLRSRDYFFFNEETNAGIWRIQSKIDSVSSYRTAGVYGRRILTVLLIHFAQNSSPPTAARLKLNSSPTLLVIIVIEYFCKTRSNTILNYGLDGRGFE